MTPSDMVLTPRGLRFRGRLFPCAIGKGRISTSKQEGDRATPAGRHRITGLLFRPDRMARPAAWARPVTPGDLWSDDIRDPDYNHMVRAPHPFSHERLCRPDPLYDLILLTDWNWPDAIPGQGSAIFIHQWRRPGYPTEGCIALSRSNLLTIAKLAPPGTRLIVPAASFWS